MAKIKKPEPPLIVKQVVKQEKENVKQSIPTTIKPSRIPKNEVNPVVESLDDIPNTNIITSGRLLGIRLRAEKKIMLKQLIEHSTKLLNKKD